MALLEVDHLTKRHRGGVEALRGVSLRVEAGEVLGLLGPNGAGKSTLVRCVLGLSAPTGGTVHLQGIDVEHAPQRARTVCSYQPQALPPMTGMRVADGLAMAAAMRGVSLPEAEARAARLLARFGLEEWARKRCDRTTGGVRRLLGFCMAVIVPGRVVVLDEPTNDLDPHRRHALWGCVRELADAGHAVLLVTHNVHEADTVVDRALVLADGVVQGEALPPGLEARYRALVPGLGWGTDR